MKRIIEHGKYRLAECTCGCKFSFDITDLIVGAESSSVTCPECGESVTVEVLTTGGEE